MTLLPKDNNGCPFLIVAPYEKLACGRMSHLNLRNVNGKVSSPTEPNELDSEKDPMNWVAPYKNLMHPLKLGVCIP